MASAPVVYSSRGSDESDEATSEEEVTFRRIATTMTMDVSTAVSRRISLIRSGLIMGVTSTSSVTAKVSDMEANLSAGQKALRMMRIRVSGAILVGGFVCSAAAQFGYHMDAMDLDGPTDGVSWLLSVACVLLLATSPLPDDKCLTCLVIVVNAAILGVDFIWNVEALEDMDDYSDENVGKCKAPIDSEFVAPALFCWWKRCMYMAYISLSVLFLVGSCYLLFGVWKVWHRAQFFMWALLRVFFYAMLATDLTIWIAQMVALRAWTDDAGCSDLSGCVFMGSFWYIWGDALGTTVASFPKIRHHVHSCLRKCFASARSSAAAAGVASLVGNCPANEVRRQATARFVSISFSKLAYDDLATNDPSPELFRLTVPTRLGLCDAFISHSWHDDAVSKWKELESWNESFVSQRGREATMWLDKCCIDQSSIADDLRCLPLFVRGCKSMVVLCGVTYLLRLWCVMELFTFVHMGGDCENIRLILLLRAGREAEDRMTICDLVRAFDVQRCECAERGDKEKMLEIIHTAFGTLRDFNDALRDILVSTCSGQLPDILATDPDAGCSSSEGNSDEVLAVSRNSSSRSSRSSHSSVIRALT